MEKTNYIQIYEQPLVFAYSFKVGSTTLIKRYVASRQGGFVNQRNVNPRHTITLYVRHPLDRLVSAWRWFTQHHNSYMKDILADNLEDHNFLLDDKTKFEPWIGTAMKYENLHWYPTVKYHTNEKGIFLPNNLRLLADLGGEKTKTTKHDSWETYYSDELRERMESLYADDLTLYRKVKERKDGIDTRT